MKSQKKACLVLRGSCRHICLRKVQKSKNVYINYFYRNLKYLKIESKNHRKIAKL